MLAMFRTSQYIHAKLLDIMSTRVENTQSVKNSYTYTVSAAPFRNDLQAVVKASFSPSGFLSLKKLDISQRASIGKPYRISPRYSTASTIVHGFDELQSQRPKTPVHDPLRASALREVNHRNKIDNRHGCFSSFEYQSCPYDMLREELKRERELRSLMLTSFSRKPFSCTASKIRMKHEDIVENENYSFPLLGPSVSDHVQKPRGEKRRGLKTDFRLGCASGVALSASIAQGEQRRSLATWCRTLFDAISKDWPHTVFRLQVTAADEIIFYFETTGADNTRIESGRSVDIDALKKYMTHLAVHGHAAELKLSRRIDRWGVTESNDGVHGSAEASQHVVFSFFAPWAAGAGSLALRRVDSLRCRVKARQLVIKKENVASS
jgi:hypothetical protein